MRVKIDPKAEFLHEAASAIRAGKRPTRAIDDYCALVGCSRQAAYKLLAHNGLTRPRKTRSDAGTSKVSADDAMRVAGLQQRTVRKDKSKRELPMTVAREALLEDGVISTASESTYRRQLRRYSLDRTSRHRPTPHAVLRSAGPNAVWQIDASQARQWYLREGKYAVNPDAAYDEIKIETKRDAVLKRYIVVDHSSAAFWVMYVAAHGETTVDFLRCLWEAMAYKGESFPLSGIPEMLFSDPGSGLTSAAANNLYDALGIHYQPHEAGNPRAKGTVETRHGWWEARFENLLLARGIMTYSVDELNQMAYESCRKWNAQKIVRRLKAPAFAWYEENLDRAALRYPPDWEVCLRLAQSKEITRLVRRDWLIQDTPTTGNTLYYSLRTLSDRPECQPGSTVHFTRDATGDGAIHLETDDGHEHLMHPLDLGSDGRPSPAAVIGYSYKSPPDDIGTTARKAALGLELPAAEREKQKVATLKTEHRDLPRFAWIDQYAELWDLETTEARAVYDKQYGEAKSAPEADLGVEMANDQLPITNEK